MRHLRTSMSFPVAEIYATGHKKRFIHEKSSISLLKMIFYFKGSYTYAVMVTTTETLLLVTGNKLSQPPESN